MKNNIFKYISLLFVLNFICLIGAKAYVEDRAYSVGDMIVLDKELYFTIVPSDSDQKYVTVIKDIPLTVDEVNTYGQGYINEYNQNSTGTAFAEKYTDSEGNEQYSEYGGLAYYTSENCHDFQLSSPGADCKTNYQESSVKHLIDNWAESKSFHDSLIEVDGYKTRLIKFEELQDYLGYNNATWAATNFDINKEYTPKWFYKSYNCNEYWTMSLVEDHPFNLYTLRDDGDLGYSSVTYYHVCVKPVLNIEKNVSKPEPEITNNQNEEQTEQTEQTNNIVTTIVKVTDTFLEKSYIPSLIGGIGLLVGLIIYGIISYKNSKK